MNCGTGLVVISAAQAPSAAITALAAPCRPVGVRHAEGALGRGERRINIQNCFTQFRLPRPVRQFVPSSSRTELCWALIPAPPGAVL
jgi:hypothetical protein